MSEPNHSAELAENGAENYPDTLRITVGSVDSMFDAAIAQLGDDGESDEAVRSFDSVADVRQLLTDRRVELMRSIMTASPDSITDLADRLVATIRMFTAMSRYWLTITSFTSTPWPYETTCDPVQSSPCRYRSRRRLRYRTHTQLDRK